MRKILVEVCCGSVAEAYRAASAGADRIELNSMLSLGGLTPSIGMVKLAKNTGLDLMVMLRPRGGDFCYSGTEFETMLADAEALREAGAGGVVFGILRKDGTVDERRCKKILEAALPLQGVFHRAIDRTPDWKEALDALIGLGLRRVLSSGQKPGAQEGIPILRAMIRHAAGRIEILPGGGIRKPNVQTIVDQTGCTQVHFSMRKSAAEACRSQDELYPQDELYDQDALADLIRTASR
jgi:copper homeostasis protein